MTNAPIPVTLLREMRQRVIDVIAGYKAYDVPSIAKRVGSPRAIRRKQCRARLDT